jgi:hypothetical protein
MKLGTYMRILLCVLKNPEIVIKTNTSITTERRKKWKNVLMGLEAS